MSDVPKVYERRSPSQRQLEALERGRIKKGEVRNPRGISSSARTEKRKRFQKVMEELLDEYVDVPRYGRVELRQAIAHAFLQEVKKGKRWAFIEFLKRIWPVPIEVSGPEGGPIPIDIIERARAEVVALIAREGPES